MRRRNAYYEVLLGDAERRVAERRAARNADVFDLEGNLVPQDGVYVPTRTELANLVQEIALDAGGPDATVAQPLAERIAQYCDAIYAMLAFAERAYPLLANLTDDDECRFDHHGNCQTHHLERTCSVAASRDLLDEFAEFPAFASSGPIPGKREP